MKIETESHELYEDLAKLFRSELVKTLSSVLDAANIQNEVKKELCAEFLSELCVNFDQGEWQYKSDYYRPVLTFVSGKDLYLFDNKKTLYMPYEAYHHHDKVWGEIEESFDSN